MLSPVQGPVSSARCPWLLGEIIKMFCGVGIINLGPGTWDVATQQVATPAGRRIKLDKIFTRKYLQLICPKLFESVTLVEAAVGRQSARGS